jgi:hypothetical protein
VDTERTSFVACSRDNATAFGSSTNRDGQSPEIRSLTLLDRRIKRIHINVDDPT